MDQTSVAWIPGRIYIVTHTNSTFSHPLTYANADQDRSLPQSQATGWHHHGTYFLPLSFKRCVIHVLADAGKDQRHNCVLAKRENWNMTSQQRNNTFIWRWIALHVWPKHFKGYRRTFPRYMIKEIGFLSFQTLKSLMTSVLCARITFP